MTELMRKAAASGEAVGSFSVGNMEMVMAAVAASEATGKPIIMQIAEKRLAASPLELMGPMMVGAAKSSEMPIAVHLDHGLTRECVRAAMDCGFSSVMFDGSLLPYEENVAVTKELVDEAHSRGIAFEAELGVVGGNEGDTAEHVITYTDPDVAVDFSRRTGIDCLAVAIGNAHGNYKAAPKLRFDVLERIASMVSIPLVLHGGTGLTDDDFRRCIALGVRKVNIATASFDALALAAKEFTAPSDAPDYFGLSAAEVDAVKANIIRHIKVFANIQEV